MPNDSFDGSEICGGLILGGKSHQRLGRLAQVLSRRLSWQRWFSTTEHLGCRHPTEKTTAAMRGRFDLHGLLIRPSRQDRGGLFTTIQTHPVATIMPPQ